MRRASIILSRIVAAPLAVFVGVPACLKAIGVVGDVFVLLLTDTSFSGLMLTIVLFLGLSLLGIMLFIVPLVALCWTCTGFHSDGLGPCKK